MIALPGVCISTGQYEDAESILRTFAKYERNGLMPNLFPEGKNEPMYNTADAALLFVNCVWLLFRATGNAEFVKEMYPVMERIIDYYQSGTDYNIHMDADGLIAAGSGLDQVTWMDVRAGDILPTPRHGKPVEINAYWYNALRIMGEFSLLLAGADTSEGCRAENVPYHSGEERYSRRSEQYDRMAEQAAKAFRDKFWMEVLESALREGCIGQLPEIYDGADPVSSKGCFAQAWSVGEMLRVYEALEDKHAL